MVFQWVRGIETLVDLREGWLNFRREVDLNLAAAHASMVPFFHSQISMCSNQAHEMLRQPILVMRHSTLRNWQEAIGFVFYDQVFHVYEVKTLLDYLGWITQRLRLLVHPLEEKGY